jgi:hypothetical protein
MNLMNKKMTLALIALVAMTGVSCSSELTDNAAPVELVVTNTQNLHRLDLDPTTNDAECDESVGTINMQVFPKNDSATGPFIGVRVTRYRVSYRRLDGGSLVPASFVRPIDTLINVGQTAGSDFIILEAGAFSRAPFAALQPQNGGIDPETGKSVVTLEVIVEVWGETLAGDNVYDSTSFPLEFCYACGGCS